MLELVFDLLSRVLLLKSEVPATMTTLAFIQSKLKMTAMITGEISAR